MKDMKGRALKDEGYPGPGYYTIKAQR